ALERPVRARIDPLQRNKPQAGGRRGALVHVDPLHGRPDVDVADAPAVRAVADAARDPLLDGGNVAGVAPARHARPSGPRAPAVLARRLLAGLVAEMRGRPREHPAAAVDPDLEALPIVLVEARVCRLVDQV